MSVYKPNMQRTCCPAYTIRLEVDAFSPSKDQARVLRRMQRWLTYCDCCLEAQISSVLCMCEAIFAAIGACYTRVLKSFKATAVCLQHWNKIALS